MEQWKSIAAQVRTQLPTHLYSLLDIFLNFCYIFVYLFTCMCCMRMDTQVRQHAHRGQMTACRSWCHHVGPGNSTQVLKISGKCLSLLSEVTGPQVFVLPTFLFILHRVSSSQNWLCIPDPSAMPPEWRNCGHAPPCLFFLDVIYLVSPAVFSALILYGSPHHRSVVLLCPTKVKLLFLKILCKAPLLQQILRDSSSETLEAR